MKMMTEVYGFSSGPVSCVWLYCWWSGLHGGTNLKHIYGNDNENKTIRSSPVFE